MSTRKNIPPRVRFEVLKRDLFTCAYCGAKSPGVMLQVDHIAPVAAGGGNEIDNLITSCSKCNGGKGAVPLTTAAATHVRAANLQREREIAEVDEAYNEWLRERREAAERLSVTLCKLWSDRALFGAFELGEAGRDTMRRFAGKLVEEEIRDAIEIACRRVPCSKPDPRYHPKGQKYKAMMAAFDRRFRYFCGVCHQKIKGAR